MKRELPRRVRRKIAGLRAMVSHSTGWGYHCQGMYPGEQIWTVNGGPDWPLNPKEQVVRITACYRGGIEVEGLDAVESEIERVSELAAEDPSDPLPANQLAALEEVLEVLRAANNNAA